MAFMHEPEYRFEDGEIEVDSIVPITIEQITPRLARECGCAGVSDLLKVAKHGRGERIFLVDFHYIAPKSDLHKMMHHHAEARRNAPARSPRLRVSA